MPDNEIRKVFISSTTRDLGQYREVAQAVIQDVSNIFTGRFVLAPVSMDTQSQTGDPTTPLEVSRAWVRDSCDWVVLIVAWNYGYVPPGASCSVTESEYLQAMSSEKRCFVFLPGELPDPPEYRYRALDRQLERENLADWRGQSADPAQVEGLAKFKQQLREKRFDLFRDIEDFRAKLTRALTQRIINERFQTLGPEIVDLGLQPPLQACFREVKLLARLKRMHDILHRIRQFGIRTWREELAASWPDDGEPPMQAQYKYLQGTPDIADLRGTLTGLAEDLPEPVRTALPPLGKLIGYKFPRVPSCGKAAFIESTEDFASWVQRLFTGCDTQMGLSADRLARHYETLRDTTRSVLERKQVAPDREESLRAELDRSIQIHTRLQQVLANHRDWQQMHDELERIDYGIEAELPSDDDSTRARRQRNFSRTVEDLVDTGGARIRSLLTAATDIVTAHPERLTQWPGLILLVGKHLDSFVQAADVDTYATMRKHFDDLFFLIDLETLESVKTAEDRVRAIEAGLQGRDLNTAPGGL